MKYKIRKKILSIALLSTVIAVALIRVDIEYSLITLIVSMGLHSTHILLYLKKID